MALLVYYNFVGVRLSWVAFLQAISYAAALAGLALTLGAAVYFQRRLRRSNAQVADVSEPAPATL